ncbi:RagB/SusD family nutrient uptake outer membrane protein [Paludibacter jiangxiensis]|uniref:Starch-binding associating with outer membrane n=1 Tax=Paludibacter jiangxiensis TaxID=681398 RepID=A0A171AF45_9BACT|nr:RagB/SusD family nutrient uptake outer membrane protein [Paludibacter jiangxiensis]GAT63631.1 starch-binding associating with outer membrane [Paludibacter jiangxiensis]
MKNMIRIFLLFILCTLASCSTSFLDEKPLDFLSSDNAYQTYSDFKTAVNMLYSRVRSEFYSKDENRPFDYLYGTDLVFDGQPSQSSNRHSPMSTAYNSTGDIALSHWTELFKIVADANTITSRLSASSMTDSQKKLVEAQARFFRGLAYRTLAYLYGGVPLLTAEVTSVKNDYVRATKADVLKQVIDDLVFAASNLPSISSVQDGEVSNLAASHLLSEVYLATGEYQKAVDAASVVIGDANMGLMQNRFGSESTTNPGDVYWDMFRPGNQNRKSGNKEAIWVIQFETDVNGGSLVSTAQSGYLLERHHSPMVRDLSIGGVNPFRWPVSDYTGGRGVGWAISTVYFSDTIWKSDFTTDMRNANHNFVRNFVGNKVGTAYYGKIISTQTPPAGVTVPNRSFYPYQSKCTTPYHHPAGLYSNAATFDLKSTAGGTYTDQYMFRLAETYLLRAEAYLGLKDQEKAAADINVVRARAKASPVAKENVTIDYILDERMRELGVEEKRRITLMRLGKLYDRVMKCNPFYATMAGGMIPTYNLWPIPFSVIEANTGAKLEQNPGY